MYKNRKKRYSRDVALDFKKLLSIMTVASILSVNLQAVEVYGHRGMRGPFLENTLPAFEGAIAAGCDTIELDLRLTKDLIPVIHHDPTLGGKRIFELTLAAIKKEEPRIATLEELLSWLEEKGAKTCRLDLEIKRDPFHPEESASSELLAEKIVTLVKSKGFEGRVFYTSFDPAVLAAVRKEDPKATLGLIYDQRTLHRVQGVDALLKLASSMRVSHLICQHTLLRSADEVAFLQQKGFQVVAWTVNEPKRWEELIEMGVNGIVTDVPAALMAHIAALSCHVAAPAP